MRILSNPARCCRILQDPRKSCGILVGFSPGKLTVVMIIALPNFVPMAGTTESLGMSLGKTVFSN